MLAADQFCKVDKANTKNKFVNLYSQEKMHKDKFLLQGRRLCNCQASKHNLINNCLKCGKVVCTQEGAGAQGLCGVVRGMFGACGGLSGDCPGGSGECLGVSRGCPKGVRGVPQFF